MPQEILIIEDDEKLNNGIRLALKDKRKGNVVDPLRCESSGWKWY